jgi:hypothetical protein
VAACVALVLVVLARSPRPNSSGEEHAHAPSTKAGVVTRHPPTTQRGPAATVTAANGLRAQLFRGQNFEQWVMDRTDRQVDWLWGFGAPDPAMPADNFSIRWEGWIKAPRPGRYRLTTLSDDGARVWLDGERIIDHWQAQPLTRYPATVTLTDQPHALRIEYVEVGGPALMSFRWQQIDGFDEQVVPAEALFHDRAAARAATVRLPPSGDPRVNGLRADLFVGPEFERKVKPRIDLQVNWLWGLETPDPFLPPDNFSIRWEGWLKPPWPGRYRLIAVADDSVRLWLDDNLKIDQWPGRALRYEVEVDLADRPHPLRIDYQELTHTAFMSLRWAQVGGFAEEAVPPTALFHVLPKGP